MVEKPTRERLVIDYGNCCLRCKTVFTSIKKVTVDHVLPKSKGGKNDYLNYQPLCTKCNGLKAAEFIDYRLDHLAVGSFLRISILEYYKAKKPKGVVKKNPDVKGVPTSKRKLADTYRKPIKPISTKYLYLNKKTGLVERFTLPLDLTKYVDHEEIH